MENVNPIYVTIKEMVFFYFLKINLNIYFFSKQYIDLHRMYKLVSRIKDGIQPMLEILQTYIVATGLDAVKSLAPKDATVHNIQLILI